MAETQAKAILKNINVSPRKARLVANSIKGKHVIEALAQLDNMPQRSTVHLSKLIRSAIANAKEQKMDESKLIVKSIRVDKGVVLKRVRARARGRATLVEKKMSHIALELAESDKVEEPEYSIKEKEKKERRPKAEKPQTQKPKFEEKPKEVKAKRGFRERIFRRKSV